MLPHWTLNSYIFQVHPIVVEYKILEFVDLRNGQEIRRVSQGGLWDIFFMSSLNFPELIFGDWQRYRGLKNFWGRDCRVVLGDSQHSGWTFLPPPLPCPRLSTSCLTIVTLSLYHPHPNTISSLSTHCHLVVRIYKIWHSAHSWRATTVTLNRTHSLFPNTDTRCV